MGLEGRVGHPKGCGVLLCRMRHPSLGHFTYSFGAPSGGVRWLHPWAGTFPWHLAPAFHHGAFGQGLVKDRRGHQMDRSGGSGPPMGTYTCPSPLRTRGQIASPAGRLESSSRPLLTPR